MPLGQVFISVERCSNQSQRESPQLYPAPTFEIWKYFHSKVRSENNFRSQSKYFHLESSDKTPYSKHNLHVCVCGVCLCLSQSNLIPATEKQKEPKSARVTLVCLFVIPVRSLHDGSFDLWLTLWFSLCPCSIFLKSRWGKGAGQLLALEKQKPMFPL